MKRHGRRGGEEQGYKEEKLEEKSGRDEESVKGRRGGSETRGSLIFGLSMLAKEKKAHKFKM